METNSRPDPYSELEWSAFKYCFGNPITDMSYKIKRIKREAGLIGKEEGKYIIKRRLVSK